jgi:dCTP deaminase
MIEPFSERQVRDGVISHGVFPVIEAFASAAGSRLFHQYQQRHHRSKGFGERSLVAVQAGSVIVPPNSVVLA